LRSAFGAGSLDEVELELESLEDGVLLDGVLDIDGDGDVLCGVALGSVVVAPGAAVGFCDFSVAGAPCAGGELLLSVVCA
jgi:hypothetical protein